jgi:hypothetical protein
MNKNILTAAVQAYINANLHADVSKIALGKSPFQDVSAPELALQLAAKKKSAHKLPNWFNAENIYYPALLSIEQCSSVPTATYKANLATGKKLIDLTAGFGVDSYFFSKKVERVSSCELNPELAAIAAHNAKILNAPNLEVFAVDGINFLAETLEKFDTIYIDPARRNVTGKVFRLADCTPDITVNLPLLLDKAERIIIKTSPLLDMSSGLSELQQVSEIHILSIKNECKELLWIIDKNHSGTPKIICATLNNQLKTFSFLLSEIQAIADIGLDLPTGYLYEPDVALLKSGAFNLIGKTFNLKKLHAQSQLYFSSTVDPTFLGRIFEIEQVLTLGELKKEKHLIGNVIVRNFMDRPENLVKKYKITPSHDHFIIFTQLHKGYVAIKAKILQHY